MRQFITIFLILISSYRGLSTDPEKPRVIHVFVALCDNENQGIVPVPEIIGNGQDPGNNLYWGASYGVKTFFDKKSDHWTLIEEYKNLTSNVLERVVFKNTDSETYLIADAYDGAKIRESIIDFLHATTGQLKDTLSMDTVQLLIGGHADLIAYVGHNGLMDFDINEKYKVNTRKMRDVIILACYSKHYFKRYMEKFNTNPLVWSTGLMSPEAYTLAWAIDGWILDEDNNQIIERARNAYNQYQRCGIKGASNLLTTGF